MLEFTENDWGQRDIIKRIITLIKQGISQPKFSNMTKYITSMNTYKTGLDQLINDGVHSNKWVQREIINKLKYDPNKV